MNNLVISTGIDKTPFIYAIYFERLIMAMHQFLSIKKDIPKIFKRKLERFLHFTDGNVSQVITNLLNGILDIELRRLKKNPSTCRISWPVNDSKSRLDRFLMTIPSTSLSSDSFSIIDIPTEPIRANHESLKEYNISKTIQEKIDSLEVINLQFFFSFFMC